MSINTTIANTITNQHYTLIDTTATHGIDFIYLDDELTLHFLFANKTIWSQQDKTTARRNALEWLLDPANSTTHKRVQFDTAIVRDDQPITISKAF
ncbi:hypothetical protein [Bifidobacterium sp. SO1]|uniref:hypothetical protein n=1 Tax=Bifidobacterium sp. SO1 TaxID=2809029 RepID=UPI001BDD956F|nr:hypothetical protein [Bifidobacterium sp. SO1]MBT1162191.1 hypothetical protein [Bifidobacterium sp. SO1]